MPLRSISTGAVIAMSRFLMWLKRGQKAMFEPARGPVSFIVTTARRAAGYRLISNAPGGVGAG